MFNLFVAVIWVIYLLGFLIIKFGVSPKSALSIPTTVKFKATIVILAFLHFLIYVFYIGKIGVFENNILSYPFLFVLGVILMIGGLVLSLVAYYQSRKFDITSSEIGWGVFKRMRWPIHAGLLMLWFGIALIYNNYAGLLVGIVFVLPLIYSQTKLIEKHFVKITDEKGLGEKYRNYIKDSWLLFPKFK